MTGSWRLVGAGPTGHLQDQKGHQEAERVPALQCHLQVALIMSTSEIGLVWLSPLLSQVDGSLSVGVRYPRLDACSSES